MALRCFQLLLFPDTTLQHALAIAYMSIDVATCPFHSGAKFIRTNFWGAEPPPDPPLVSSFVTENHFSKQLVQRMHVLPSWFPGIPGE